MKPRPLYRWKSIWLGMLVLWFLCWAWWLSYHYWSTAVYGRKGVAQKHGYVAVGQQGDCTRVGSDGRTTRTFLQHVQVGPGRFIFQLLPPPIFVRGEEKPDVPFWDKPAVMGIRRSERKTFADYVKSGFVTSPKDWWGVYIPHWLLVVVFLGVWVSFLGWRWRRMRCHAAGVSVADTVRAGD